MLQTKSDIKTEELKRVTQLRLFMYMKPKSAPLVEKLYGTVLRNMICSLSFSTGYLCHLLSRMNDVSYVNNSFTFFHISICLWIHLNFILQCYLNHSFNSLSVQSEVTNVKVLFRSWTLYSVIFMFRTQTAKGLVAGMLFSTSTNITEI